MRYSVRDKEVNTEHSPIEQKLMEYSNVIEKALSFNRNDCSFCGGRDNGVSDIKNGTFKCRICLINEEGKRLENDPEMIRLERVWNLRNARKRYLEEQEH